LGALPNRPRLKLTVAHTVSKASVVQLLRHQADGARAGAVVAHDVVAVTVTRAAAGVDDAADDADQRGLAGAVGAEQREDLARRISRGVHEDPVRLNANSLDNGSVPRDKA
jgi:hypothetical protein